MPVAKISFELEVMYTEDQTVYQASAKLREKILRELSEGSARVLSITYPKIIEDKVIID